MSYIGVQPGVGQYRKLDDISGSFNGSTTTFTTSVAGENVTAISPQQLIVSVGGVIQQPVTDYTTSTNSIIFSTAPGSGLDFFAVLMGDAINIGTPSDGSVTTAKLGTDLTVDLASGTAAAPSLTFDSNTGLFSSGADEVAISTGGSQRTTVDSSGRLLVGTSSARSNFYSGSDSAALQIEGTGTNRRFSITGADNASVLILARQRSGSVGGNTVLNSGDLISSLSFQGNDGTNFIEAATINTLVDGTPGANDMPGRIVFSTTANGASSPTERMRIDSSGNVGVGISSPGGPLHVYRGLTHGEVFRLNGSPDGNVRPLTISTEATGGLNGSLYRFNIGSSAGTYAFSVNNTERIRINYSGTVSHIVSASVGLYSQNATNASYASDIISQNCNRAANSAYYFLTSYSDNYADAEFRLRGDGNGLCDGTWTGGGADYAEYFEWKDNNPGAEDRRGISVVLDGDKIREAQAGEDPIGVISGNPSVVGDAAWNKWNGKYLRDEFGTYIQEDYEVEDEDGNTVIQQRRKLNPAYDPDMEYVSREERPEWDCVGLMGKLRMRKGQVTGSRWIKMRDINNSVEEWLVR